MNFIIQDHDTHVLYNKMSPFYHHTDNNIECNIISAVTVHTLIIYIYIFNEMLITMIIRLADVNDEHYKSRISSIFNIKMVHLLMVYSILMLRKVICSNLLTLKASTKCPDFPVAQQEDTPYVTISEENM